MQWVMQKEQKKKIAGNKYIKIKKEFQKNIRDKGPSGKGTESKETAERQKTKKMKTMLNYCYHNIYELSY